MFIWTLVAFKCASSNKRKSNEKNWRKSKSRSNSIATSIQKLAAPSLTLATVQKLICSTISWSLVISFSLSMLLFLASQSIQPNNLDRISSLLYVLQKRWKKIRFSLFRAQIRHRPIIYELCMVISVWPKINDNYLHESDFHRFDHFHPKK